LGWQISNRDKLTQNPEVVQLGLKAILAFEDFGNRKRGGRLMQNNGIRARGKRCFRVVTTDRRHDLPIAPKLLNRNRHSRGPI
jgi:hypothetical protein